MQEDFEEKAKRIKTDVKQRYNRKRLLKKGIQEDIRDLLPVTGTGIKIGKRMREIMLKGF